MNFSCMSYIPNLAHYYKLKGWLQMVNGYPDTTIGHEYVEKEALS